MNFSFKSILVLIIYALLSTSSSYAFQSVETEFFAFYYYQQYDRAAQILIQKADSIAQEISNSLGFAFLNPVDVFIVPTFEDAQKIQPPGARIPIWAIGVAFPLKNLIIIIKKKRVDLEKTFRHEVNHILLGQAFKGKQKVPRWLDEGLAMIQAREWSMSRLSTITSAVLTDSLIPMDDLAESFPSDLRNAELAYCQSFYFISFLKGEFGNTAFKDFLKEYCKHKNFSRAIIETYHISWDRMEDLWLDYLRLRFSWIPIITSTSTLWFIASLIFIMGYVRKRRKSHLKKHQWENEEQLLYGKDEDTFQ
jgi:hypothetical protein